MSSPIRPPLWITETDGNPSGRPINKIVVSNGTLSISGTTATITTGGTGGGSGTVTNVSSTDSFISISNPSTTPSITIQDATTSQSGILTSTDWNTFNNKTANAGTVTSVSASQAFVTVASATTTPSITIGNASGLATGVLTSTDWTTFNNKSSQTIALTTTGSSGAATLIGSTLNIPQYSGGGGGTGTVTVGTYGGNNNLAYFSGTTEISNTNNISINAAAGSGDFFGQLEASKHMAASDGSATVPSFAFSNATNLGFFKDGSTSVSFTSGGIRQMSFDSNGVIRLGGSASNLSTYSNDLVLDTDLGTNSGSITINSGVNGNIDILPNGTGKVKLGTLPFKADQTVGVGQDNYVLTYDNASDSISLEAAGGGGSSVTPKFSGVKANGNAYYDLSAYPTGWRTTTYTNITETQAAPIYSPFTCGIDLTLGTLGIEVSVAGDAGLNYLLAIYSVDAAGLPDSKLVSATASADATGTQTGTITETSAGDGNLVAGTQYYYAYTQSFDATSNPSLRSAGAQFHGSFTDSTIGTQRQAIRAGVQGTLPATYPGSGVVLGTSIAIVGCTYG